MLTVRDLQNLIRAATFLSALGKNTFQVLRNLMLPEKVYGKSLDQVTKVLLNHYEPKPLVISERFNFNRRNQEPNESIQDHIAELRRLTVHCEFGNFLDEALRDRFVCGLRSESMQKKLLVEEGLTFARAVEIAQSMESAAQKTKLLQSTATTVSPTPEVNMLTFRGKADSCYRCGHTDHPPTHCPFKNAQCHNCGKIGQIQQDCRSKPKDSPLSHNWRGRGGGARSRKHYAGGRGYNRSVRMVEEQFDSQLEDDEDYVESAATNLNHIRALNQVKSEPAQPYLVDLELDGKSLTMEVDTGACMTLVSQQTFRKVFPKREMKPSATRLTTYSGQPITAVGEVDVAVSYKSQQASLPLIVVAGSGPSLLGRNWLSSIRLDWKSIGVIAGHSPLTTLLEKYSEVFKKGLGKLIGHEAKLYVDQDASPRFCRARPVPYALRDKVEAELERLNKEGIIQPVQFADWAAPIIQL